MRAQIIKTVYIEAARRLPESTEAKSAVTGNSYRIDLIAEGEVNPEIGWVVDYGDIKQFFEAVHQMLDHRCLSDIPGLAGDISTEVLERWIADQLHPWPDWFAGVRVSVPAPDAFRPIRLTEDPVLGLGERIAFGFSAAQSLPQLPEGHPCRSLHGHTYQIEIAATALDTILPAAERIYEHLNNTCLNRVPGLEQATAERIAAWVWHQLLDDGVTPELVAVQETPSNRCHYFGK